MTEFEFEKSLIEKLCNTPISTEEEKENEFHVIRTMNWTYVPEIKTTEQLWDNFKQILERHNQDALDGPLSKNEFAQVKRIINDLTTPFKAGQFLYGLNGVSQIEIDLDNGKHVFLTVFDQSQIGAGSTVYQVVNQIHRPAVIPGKKNRIFDVTLLINGLPIIQIELKTAIKDINEGLNQMHQYAAENQYSGIFSTVQILIAMSPNNARYMANTTSDRFNKAFAFHWQRRTDNEPVRDWKEFTDSFLSIPMAHNMATNYMILDGTPNKEALKVMRPYQVEATEKVIKAIDKNDFEFENGKLGYIWHTTGSGKTITSFKTAWLASKRPNVDKVIFLVDRRALTSQTLENYRAYDPEAKEKDSSIEDTQTTNELSKKLKEKNNNIIITSVQKMNRLVTRKNFKAPDRHFVFIVDEAHRSTGGQGFEQIQKAFKKSAWIGYTGTPMFDGTNDRYTTKEIFGPLLHAYTIREAIADKNVLGFKVDFMTTITEEAMRKQYLPQFFRNEHPDWSEEEIKERINNMSEYDMDDNLSKSFYDNNYDHVHAVVENIMRGWKNRSVNGKYNAILTTRVGGGSSIPMAMMYFREFLRANEEEPYGVKLNVAVTFSQDTSNGDTMLTTNKELDYAIDRYNEQFGTHFDSSSVDEYMEDLASRLKKTNREGKTLDLVIVVDQLLTGFDAPQLNTLYVDRTLKDAALVQAYSRTNRLDDPNDKPYGHVVNFRWPKENEKLMKDALSVYSNKDNANKTSAEQEKLLEDEGILAKGFEEVLKEVQEQVKDIRKLTNNFVHIPPSESQANHLLKLLRDYNSGVAKLKQFPFVMDHGNENGRAPESGYDYNDPDKLIEMMGMTPDESQMLNTVIVNELKQSIAKKKNIPPILIDLKVEYLKDVIVNYDYLTKLLEDLLNQVHNDEEENIEETERQIYKFANGLEDRAYAKEIISATKAIKSKEFPPENYSLKYPYELTDSEQIVKDAKNISINRKLLEFRNKWGITDVVTSKTLLAMISHHRYGEQDMDQTDQITDILKEGSKTYKELAMDSEIQELSKIKYRNELRKALYDLADMMTQPE